ncbi:hypothetical protein H634G_01260 [Metarhizium anisopliae BRIP 53293]|uniref:Beta-glucuronidase C-terminal domain-containing protein n=1 Tax=Metarhizium anisopliae BRIP 53293 TaxID=1291518 RepID=A0A0D9PAM9_METAN|nr:hypothetical protein H634G_01260 [Metarhizium anisopliae BRIP 53293]KJK94568.1 hypothetical protein H633G_01502 [Metarhizium anisopliae BRIP 53284]
MFNLCSAGLVAVLAAKESQAALYHINTRADDDSGLPESFVSFSIELSSFVDYAGNLRHTPNAFSYNLLRNLGNLMGSKPYVRVGGNTQDYALYNASLKEAINGTYDPNKSKDYPTTIYIWGLGAVGAAGWETLERTAALACKALSNDNLDAWEYGYQRNNYPNSAQGPTRPRGWSARDVADEWLNGTRGINKQIQKHCPELADFGFMAPSYDDRVSNLNATQAWGYGLDKYGSVRLYSVHNYIDGATSPAVTLQGTLVNHSRTIRDVDEQVAEYKRTMSTNKAVTNHATPHLLGETNSLYFQNYRVSTFYLLFPTTQNLLYHRALNYTRLQQYQAFQPIDTNKTSKGTKAPYYGSIGVAAALGDLTKSSVSVSPIPMLSDQEAAYAIFERGNLKRLMVINMHRYNTTKDGAGTEPLPNPPGRMNRGFSFAARNLARDVSIREQRLMTNGSDAITGVTFDEWSYNWELDNGKPVRLDNIATGETFRSKQGVITVMVPDSSATLLHLEQDGGGGS